jgi:hypothetical protein
MDGEPPQSRGDSRRLFRRRHRPRRPESFHGLGWLDVLKHAWGRIKTSWGAALAGAVATAALPVLIQWGAIYDFSESGWDKVTANGWIWSVVAVGAWLMLVALWHFLCAPMAHTREVLSAHHCHYAAEIARAREEASASRVVNVGDRHYHFNFGENPDPAALAAVLKGEIDPEPLRSIGVAEEKPTPPNPSHERPKPPQKPQDAEEQTDDPGQDESEQ